MKDQLLPPSSTEIVQKLAQALYDKKGLNILALDVSHICSMTDYFLLADGMASTHIVALKNSAEETLRSFEWHPLHVEGHKEGGWIVLDYLNIVIHLFDPKVRDYYRIEEVWKDGKIVPLELE